MGYCVHTRDFHYASNLNFDEFYFAPTHDGTLHYNGKQNIDINSDANGFVHGGSGVHVADT